MGDEHPDLKEASNIKLKTIKKQLKHNHKMAIKQKRKVDPTLKVEKVEMEKQ